MSISVESLEDFQIDYYKRPELASILMSQKGVLNKNIDAILAKVTELTKEIIPFYNSLHIKHSNICGPNTDYIIKTLTGRYDLAKIISLIMCGWLIQVSFKKTTLVIELFFIGYFLAMMLWVGVYYIQSDVRLCNVYTQESQQYAGGGLIFYAVMLSLIWIISKLNKKMAAHNKLLLKG